MEIAASFEMGEAMIRGLIINLMCDVEISFKYRGVGNPKTRQSVSCITVVVKSQVFLCRVVTGSFT